MKLMTKALAAKLPKLYATEGVPSEKKVAVVKFFMPSGRATWYAVEGQENAPGEWMFFGFCVSPLGSDCDEWGYFNLAQLQSCRGQFGLGVERDAWFKPTAMEFLRDYGDMSGPTTPGAGAAVSEPLSPADQAEEDAVNRAEARGS